MKAITLLELDEQCREKGTFSDLFDFAITEIIDFENMTGSFSDIKGDEIIEFNVIKMDNNPLEIMIEINK